MDSLDEVKHPEEELSDDDKKESSSIIDLSHESREYYRDTFYSSMDGTLIVPSSPTPDFPGYDEDGEDNKTRCSRLPSLPVYMEQQRFTIPPNSKSDIIAANVEEIEEDAIRQLSVHKSMKRKE